jgi:hypothetical protein
MRSGDEYTVALLVSPSCRACKDSAFQHNWNDVVTGIKEQAKADSAVVGIIGVSAAWSIDSGIAFLNGFKELDEIDVGSSWLNLGFEEFAVQDFPSRPSIPQVVVVRRTRRIDNNGFAVEKKQLVHRSIGVSEIARWAEAGAPVH